MDTAPDSTGTSTDIGAPPHILLAEDEVSIADTVQFALQNNGYTTHWQQTARDTLADFQAHPPALVILDVGLPDMDGFELFRQLQRLPSGAATPMLFLTARSEEIDRVVGLELGADDYIAKPFSPRELVARIRTILRRTRQIQTPPQQPASTATLAGSRAQTQTDAIQQRFEINAAQHRIVYCGQSLHLSRYEYGILCVLLRQPGRVYNRHSLLELVWDDPSGCHDRTVDTHIKTLRAKLSAIAPGIEAIRTVRGMGYALHT